MLKALLISFGSLFLVCLVAELGMYLAPRIFKGWQKKNQKDQSQNKSMESDK